jgi:hypothetical protein
VRRNINIATPVARILEASLRQFSYTAHRGMSSYTEAGMPLKAAVVPRGAAPGVVSTYIDDMVTTAVGLRDLFAKVNDATESLRRSATVPEQVIAVIDGFDSTLGAATPSGLQADPHLTSALWAAAYRAEKALRVENVDEQRRDVRVALEQFRQVLRDIVEQSPYNDDAAVREVLTRTADTLAAPQKTLADLLGVSVRQLQRWLVTDGPEPAAGDAARIRAVGQVVNQLRHTFTGPGVAAWFYRRHPSLGYRPIDLLDDPLRYPQVLSAANAARAQTA